MNNKMRPSQKPAFQLLKKSHFALEDHEIYVTLIYFSRGV